MNCQEFRLIVVELADQRLTNALTRKHALVHALACEPCGARLADERVLAGGLQVLVESTESEQASPRLKATLRAAFDERATLAASPVASNVVTLPLRMRPRFAFNPRWALAAAAALLAMFAVGMTLWLNGDSTPPSMLVNAPTPITMPTPAAPAVTPTAMDELNLVVRDNGEKPKSQPLMPRRQPGDKASVVRASEPASTPINMLDIASEYIPLNATLQTASTDDSIVVRVKVSRASLLAMGLPLNVEKAEALVSADLKVALNGTPLAIRLLQ